MTRQLGMLGWLIGALVVSAGPAAAQPTSAPGQDSLYRVMRGGKIGFIGRDGAMVIPAKFALAMNFSEGLSAASLDGHQFGYIDTRGEWAIPPKFCPSLNEFRGGYAPVADKMNDPKWGMIDRAGNWVVEPQFIASNWFADGLAVAFKPKEDTCGYIDITGKYVIPPTYNSGYPFVDGLAVVSKDAPGNALVERTAPGGHTVMWKKIAYGVIDKTGKTVVELKFDELRSFSEGLAAATKTMNQECGFIDKTGRFVIPPKFTAVNDFHEGLAPVLSNDGTGWGFIDKTGRFVIRPAYGNAAPFSNGLAAVLMDKGWGYIDRTGRVVIPGSFRRADPFTETGVAGVGVNLGYSTGYIDKTGKWLLRPVCLMSRGFVVGGRMQVFLPDQLAYLDKGGRLIGLNMPPDQVRSIEKLHRALVSAAPVAAGAGGGPTMDLTIDNSDGDDARFGWAGFLADAKGDCQSIDLPGPKGEVTVEVLGKQKFRLPLKAARPVPAAKDATLLVIVSHSDLPAGVWLKAGGASGAKDNKPPVKPPSDNGDF